MTLQPSSRHIAATEAPRSTASSISSRVMAAVSTITRPAANLQVDQSVGGRQLGVDAGIDHSQPETVLPTQKLIPAPPFKKLSTICRVTSFGDRLTFSSATP